MGGCDQGLILARTIGETGYRFVALSRPGYLGTPLTAGRTPEEQADLYADLVDNVPFFPFHRNGVNRDGTYRT
jgi:hypothetical protein